MTKKSKIAAVMTAFSFGGSIIHQPPKKVPPKVHAVGTAAILDFSSVDGALDTPF